MEKDLDLNTSADLPDHTAASQKPHPSAHAGVSAADIARGYSLPDTEPIGTFDAELDGGGTTVGNPLTQGGFLGRPRGWAR
jgi:hypothetical protein